MESHAGGQDPGPQFILGCAGACGKMLEHVLITRANTFLSSQVPAGSELSESVEKAGADTLPSDMPFLHSSACGWACASCHILLALKLL